MGSVFSPYYAWARGRGPADPTNYCSVNVALYGKRGSRWAMTERGRARLHRDATTFAVGPSALTWDGDGLTIDLNEIAAPIPQRVRGRIRVHPEVRTGEPFTIDAGGAHFWWPIAPRARVEVAMDRPGLRWTGTGYLDSNWGDESLESGFRTWTWSRAALGDGAVVLYDTIRADGSESSLALRFHRDGTAEAFDPPPHAPLATTRTWRVPRHTRGEPGAAATVTQTLEDTPFYARSVVRTQVLGTPVTAVHESLSLTRFCLPIVRLMLPFRMPRRPG